MMRGGVGRPQVRVHHGAAAAWADALPGRHLAVRAPRTFNMHPCIVPNIHEQNVGMASSLWTCGVSQHGDAEDEGAG